jgi:hypothetical protein
MARTESSTVIIENNDEKRMSERKRSVYRGRKDCTWGETRCRKNSTAVSNDGVPIGFIQGGGLTTI